jgi:hypothetical protein
MKAITATIVSGRIDLPAEFAADGSQVVVLAAGSSEPIQLSPTEELELSAAMDQIHRGEFVDGEALLSELRTTWL